jgi:hypothetical protein
MEHMISPLELAVLEEREEKRKLEQFQAEQTRQVQKLFLTGKAMEFLKQLPGTPPDRASRRKAARELAKRLQKTMRVEKEELSALQA